MAKEKKFFLTQEGLEKIKKEYKELRSFKLAKTKGESPKVLFSEELNPEYQAFREDLSFLESRMAELEYILKNAELIQPPPKEEQNIVNLGATVLVDLNGEIDEFTIVGTLEADPAKRKISNESPIGQTLLGRRAGETIRVTSSVVNHICKIIKIKYNKI